MMSLELIGEVSTYPKTSQMLDTTSGWILSQKLPIQANGADLSAKNGLAPFASFGKDFENFVGGQIGKVAQISTDLGFMK